MLDSNGAYVLYALLLGLEVDWHAVLRQRHNHV
jgi:hypothetical protein